MVRVHRSPPSGSGLIRKRATPNLLRMRLRRVRYAGVTRSAPGCFAAAIALVMVCACSTSSPSGPVTSQAAPSPPLLRSTDYGPPQAQMPLLYMHDPNDGSRLVGLDWQGNLVATVKPPETKLQQAPDGSLFQVEPGAGVGWWTGSFLTDWVNH